MLKYLTLSSDLILQADEMVEYFFKFVSKQDFNVTTSTEM